MTKIVNRRDEDCQYLFLVVLDCLENKKNYNKSNLGMENALFVLCLGLEIICG